MKYRVHHFSIRMTRDQRKLEQFLNSLEGEVVAIIPNVTPVPANFVDFLLIVEKLAPVAEPFQSLKEKQAT